MNQNKLVIPINALWLGAINGLLVGLALEEARVAYFNYQMDLAAREYREPGFWADFTTELWDPLIPFVSVLVFAVVSFLIRKYFMTRPGLLLSLWLGFGGVALALGYFMSTRRPDLSSFLSLLGLGVVAYVVHRFWKTDPESPPLLWPTVGVSATSVVALGVQLVGLFFYWPNLRRPVIWLVCLVGIVVISVIFGVFVQLISNRFKWRKSTEASAQ